MSSCPIRPMVDPSLTVNEVLRRWPTAIATLNAFGIDACCGGAMPLREAAAEASVALDDLLAAIGWAVPGEVTR